MHINYSWNFHQNIFTLTIFFIVLNAAKEFVLIYRPHPVCRFFFKIDLLTDIAALCLTDCTDWRYIHSFGWHFRPSLWTVAPMDEGTILVYCCPSSFSLTSSPLTPLSKPNVHSLYRQWVSGGGGGWIALCRPYSAGILNSVSDQMQNLPNYFPTPNKMTSENGVGVFKVPSSMGMGRARMYVAQPLPP